MDKPEYPQDPKFPLRYRLQDMWCRVTSFRITPFLKAAKLKIFKKEIVLSGNCSQCGACCTDINLETAYGWIQSIEEFESLCAENEDFTRYEPTGMDKDGYLRFHCTWLQKDNTCKDHQNRLDTCKDYPNKEFLFYNGNPVKTCTFFATDKKKEP